MSRPSTPGPCPALRLGQQLTDLGLPPAALSPAGRAAVDELASAASEMGVSSPAEGAVLAAWGGLVEEVLDAQVQAHRLRGLAAAAAKQLAAARHDAARLEEPFRQQGSFTTADDDDVAAAGRGDRAGEAEAAASATGGGVCPSGTGRTGGKQSQVRILVNYLQKTASIESFACVCACQS